MPLLDQEVRRKEIKTTEERTSRVIIDLPDLIKRKSLNFLEPAVSINHLHDREKRQQLLPTLQLDQHQWRHHPQHPPPLSTLSWTVSQPFRERWRRQVSSRASRRWDRELRRHGAQGAEGQHQRDQRQPSPCRGLWPPSHQLNKRRSVQRASENVWMLASHYRWWFIFGSDRSPRRGNVVRACVCDIIQIIIENEF